MRSQEIIAAQDPGCRHPPPIIPIRGLPFPAVVDTLRLDPPSPTTTTCSPLLTSHAPAIAGTMHRATRSLTTNYAVPVQVNGEIEIDPPRRAARRARGVSSESTTMRVTRGTSRLSAPAVSQAGLSLSAGRAQAAAIAPVPEEEEESMPEPEAGPSRQQEQPVRRRQDPIVLRRSFLEPDAIRPLKLSERAETLRKQAGHCVNSQIQKIRGAQGAVDDARLDSDLQSLESGFKPATLERSGAH